MSENLRPTVWRTARTLCNENRLRFLRAVFEANGSKGVSQLAAEIGVSISTASIYLRALNARGLVDVRRVSSRVFYGGGQDRSLPEAQQLQAAFARLFSRKDIPDDWTTRIIPILRAYSNARRIDIVRCVADNSPLLFTSLAKLAGIPETSLLRHLSTLAAGGVVVTDERRNYILGSPRNSLARAMLKIATA